MPRERQREIFSPTGAVKIANDAFEVYEAPNKNSDNITFKVKINDLSEYIFPPASKLNISIKKGSGNLETVDLGKTGLLPGDGEFNFDVELPPGRGNITCRLNVVEAGTYVYLGFSNWRHTKDANQTALFRLRESNELGNRLWDFEIDGDEYTTPVLYINNKVNGLIKALIDGDPLIQGLIFPTVITLGFREIIFNGKEGAFHGIDIDKTWQNIWWEFAKDIYDDANDIADRNDSDEQKEEFLDQLVDASVSTFDLVDRVSTYLENINEEDE